MRRIVCILCLLSIAFFASALAYEPLPPPEGELPPPPPPIKQLPPPAPSPFPPAESKMFPEVRGDSVEGNRIIREREADPDAEWSYEPVMEKGDELPSPENIKMPARFMSLNDAIAIALRNNPTVRISELNRITNKFGLETSIHNRYDAIWQPLTLTSTLQNHHYPTWSSTSGVGITTSAGTIFNIAHTNNLMGGMGSTVLTMTQPFLQNFGFEYNRIVYENAIDNEKIAQLTFKNSVIGVVNSVITSYRRLVGDYNTLNQNQKSLATQVAEVKKDLLQLSAGRMSQSDVIQQQENVESTRLTLVAQEQTIQNDYLSLMIVLGLRPSTQVIIDHQISVANQKVPSQRGCIQIALKNNIAYQQALINLNITKRALITAKNSQKWTLNATTSVTEGSQRSAFNQPIRNIGTNPSVALSLSIPIDNISLKAAVVNAQIAIESAKMNLRQQKETLIASVLAQWFSVYNLAEQIRVATRALNLQIKTLSNAKLKLRYGRSSMFEVNTLETTLLQQQVSLISTKISYLNAVLTLDQTMGITLDKWHVKLMY